MGYVNTSGWTYQMCVDRLRSIERRISTLNGQASLTRAESDESENLADDAAQINEQRLRLERAEDMAGHAHRDGYRVDHGLPQGNDGERDDRPGNTMDGQRDRAMRTLERHLKAGSLGARSAETMERLIGVGTLPARSWTARWCAATGTDAYMGAFAKLLANPNQGHLRWTAQEAEAYRVVEELRDEQRAMSLTDSAGGYLVPFHLDPSIMITNDGSVDPLLAISRVETINSDVWHGVTSAGVVANFVPEAQEVTDDSPTVGQPAIPVYKGAAFVPISIEASMDGTDVANQVGTLLMDAAVQLNAVKHTVGSGTNEPTGVITHLAGVPASVVSPGTPETLASGDVYKVQNALAPRWQANASWLANLAILNTLRQFETANGALKFPELASDKLLGRRIFEASSMDGSINPAATANNYALAYGDFRNFVIVQRIGSTIEYLPHLVGANRRPTGQRGWYLWWRTGSDVVVPEAFRLLNVATTA